MSRKAISEEFAKYVMDADKVNAMQRALPEIIADITDGGILADVNPKIRAARIDGFGNLENLAILTEDRRTQLHNIYQRYEGYKAKGLEFMMHSLLQERTQPRLFAELIEMAQAHLSQNERTLEQSFDNFFAEKYTEINRRK